MEFDFVSRQDLEKFRKELLQDISLLLQGKNQSQHKEWLKGNEVRKFLGISEGTLQNIRIKGLLKSSKLGGIHYYRYDDIVHMLQQGFSSSNQGK
jgi:hypothetical protein